MIRFVSWVRFLLWGMGLGAFGAGILVTGFYLLLTPSLPDAEQLKNVKLQTPLRIYSADNKLIAEFGEKRRSPVAVEDTPQDLLNAFLAAEDSRFFEHHGIDFRGLARATLELISTGSIQSGGSTITMQVAKNFFLSQERTFSRKFNEILLALQIEQQLSKEEIFELYLNKIYLGNRAYGIEAAANTYYGKPIQELTLAEMAMIAGLPKAPSRYNPLANLERAMERRNWILSRMLSLGFINRAQYEEAVAEPSRARYHGLSPELSAPYIAEMARQEMVQRFGDAAYEDGYRVYLTLDSKQQAAAQAAVRKGLLDYDRRHGYRGPEQHLDIAELSPEEIQQRIARLPKIGGLEPAVVIRVDKNSVLALPQRGEPRQIDWKGLSWARPYIHTNRMGPAPQTANKILKEGDLIRLYFNEDAQRWELSQVPQAQSALVAISPYNGAIMALAGGFDFYHSKFNRAIQAARQPGSSFKPFIYLAGLEMGMTPATLINDAPVVFADEQLESAWRPRNSGGRFKGPIRLRQALYESRNLVSIRLVRSLGIQPVIDYVSKFGIPAANMPRNLSLSLGTASVTPFELATAYAILANGGYRISPHFISRIESSEGDILYKANPPVACEDCSSQAAVEAPTEGEDSTQSAESLPTLQEPIISAPRIADARAVYIMHSILKDVITKGTGRGARALGRNDIAGKTGTTNDLVDAWFAGFNQDVAATVWVGFDQPQTLGQNEFGARAALPIWVDFMKEALAGKPERELPQPPGLVTVRIDAATGQRANANTENAIFEIFKAEDVPPETVSGDQPILHGEDGGYLTPEEIF